MNFTITPDDPVGPHTLRWWAFQRRLLIDHKKIGDTPAERARISHARALADEWEGKGKGFPAAPGFLLKPKTPQPMKKRGVLARLFGKE